MYKLRLFKWLKFSDHSSAADEVSRTIEHALEKNEQQYQSADPETSTQWQRLQTALTTVPAATHETKVMIERNVWRPTIAFAVTAMALLIVGMFWLFQPSTKTFATAKGQHSSMTLSDGTEVTLNHTSELIVQHSIFDRARRVSLKGEALFHVGKNGTPFIITTDVGTVQVLGTQFNVRVRNGKMEVVVLNGSVRMTARKNGMDSSVVLTKDQIAVCTKNEFPEIPTALPYPSYPGWTAGKFSFYHSSVTDACKEIEAQFDVIINIQNPQRHTETITGILDGQTIDGALTTLTQLTGTTYRHENSSYVIY
jgi:ferric-dicitrate binding protein FerR (iron transport regulator)